jgi:hypothetical protein
MLMYHRLGLLIFTWCLLDLYTYLLRCSSVASNDVMLYLIVLLGMNRNGLRFSLYNDWSSIVWVGAGGVGRLFLSLSRGSGGGS